MLLVQFQCFRAEFSTLKCGCLGASLQELSVEEVLTCSFMRIAVVFFWEYTSVSKQIGDKFLVPICLDIIFAVRSILKFYNPS